MLSSSFDKADKPVHRHTQIHSMCFCNKIPLSEVSLKVITINLNPQISVIWFV